MLNRLPKVTPPLNEMMADCGNATPKQIGKALGVNERTVKRWLSTGEAPKSALLALFWVTRWGLQWADVEVFNLAQLHISASDTLKCELAKAGAEIQALREQIVHLGRLGDFGSANDPAPGVTGAGPAEPMALTFGGFEQGWQAPRGADTPPPMSTAKPAATWARRRRHAA